MREEPGERVFDIPPEPVRPAAPAAPPSVTDRRPAERPAAAVPASAPELVEKTVPPAGDPTVNANWWRAMAEGCKGRLPPMYRAFLDLCSGVLEGDQLTVFAPDEITLSRLDNDRVKTALTEEAARAAGMNVRLLLRVGEPPKASPQENFKNLLKFGSRFDNIEIK